MSLKSTIESILFVQGEPLAISRLAKAVGAPKSEVETALRELAAEYRTRGIWLIENGDTWQFATNPENRELVEKFVTMDLSDDLTPASLEVLAIIAYKGPITRAAVEYIRGVNSSFTLRGLLMRGLIEREENPQDRRSYLYRVATDFLKHLGVAGIGELPHFNELHEIEVPAVEGSAAGPGAGG